jgi:hypothetical protein
VGHAGRLDRRNTDDEVLGDGGVGLEYRFTPHIGLFSDVRYNLVNGSTSAQFQISRGDRTEKIRGIYPTGFRLLIAYATLIRCALIGIAHPPSAPSFSGLGRNLWIGCPPIGINEDTGLFRRPAACRIHHLLNRGELYENAKLFSGICRQFPRVNE